MQDKKKCVVLGGGGHAKVLIDTLTLSGNVHLVGILDREAASWGHDIFGVPILGDDELLPQLIRDGVNCFAVGLGGVKNNRPRQKLFEFASALGLEPLTVIHPTAICSGHSQIGSGAQLFPGCIVNAGARVGANVIINSGAIVEHDCIVGNHVHIAIGAKLSSTVRVEDGAHIGAGATIRQCIVIGASAVVGAGAVVVKDVSPDSVVVGIPARPLS